MVTSSAVMIAETVKKDVVYSAECFDQKPLDSNTQLIVEYSVMALEARLMAAGDTHDTIRKIDGVISIVSGCLAIGAFVYPPAAPVLLLIAGAGSAVKFLMGLIPDDRPDLVMEKFKELEKAIHELELQMDAHFADMQAFMTEHNFDVNITTQAKTLMRFMRNCIKYHTKADLQNFADEYNRTSPLSAAYYMASFLDNRSTNPLIMAMEAEKSKTKATFKKWKKVIRGILGQLLFIEAFASGLLDRSSFSGKRIAKLWKEMDKTFDEWKDEYKKDDGYWEELKNDIDKYIETHTHLSNEQKAEEIKERLHNYLTYDSFYIVVMDQTTWEKDYSYYCPKESEQIIGAWWKGNCHAFVYRSRKGSQMTSHDYGNMRKQFQECENALRWNGTLKNILKEQLADKSMVSECGFYCLLGKGRCDPQIRYLNYLWPELLNKGPGHKHKIRLNNKSGIKGDKYYFILGFN